MGEQWMASSGGGGAGSWGVGRSGSPVIDMRVGMDSGSATPNDADEVRGTTPGTLR